MKNNNYRNLKTSKNPFSDSGDYILFMRDNCDECRKGSAFELGEGDLEMNTVYRCPIEEEINDMMCGESDVISEKAYDICSAYNTEGTICLEKSTTTPAKGLTLHLVLKSKWFDMTASGYKKEEYRRQCDYWKKRIWDRRTEISEVVLHKGYTGTTVSREVKEIVMATGDPAWGAEKGVEYYVIKYK